jgi:electron transport complex protein RnfD
MFSPFINKASSVREIMFKVLLALVPAIAVYVWYFGPAILISLTLASITALVTEAAMLKLRQRPVMPYLSDNSALLTAWLIALSIPPLAPWWLVVVGTMFAIAIAKHLYGGLGNNTFNPAMTAYAVLIISFPAAMSSWIAPHGYGQKELSWLEQLSYIFAGQLPANFTLDAVSMATPLDMLKTQMHAGHALTEIMQQPIYGHLGGHGGEIVALAYIAGGIYCWPTASSAGICQWLFCSHCLPLPVFFTWLIRHTTRHRCFTGSRARPCWQPSSYSPTR